jgi:cyclopropane-fatty-acyl-phospholipid synthase
MLLRRLIEYTVRDGALRLVEASGQTAVIGDGSEPSCTLRITPELRLSRIIANPITGIAEAYMDGHLLIEDGSLRDFMELAARNYGHLEEHPLTAFVHGILQGGRRIRQHNPIGKAQRNVAHHYDLSGQLYDLFLDADRQYSCAYYMSPDDSLETAQEQKKRHIAAKLLLDRPNLKVLDIGSGWGGLGISLAEYSGCTLDGVTLSVEQHKVSQERAEQAGLSRKVRFHLRDYREQIGPYDRIVSVGMFEHVGKKNYDEFFAKSYELLADDGVFLLHTIGRLNQPSPINPFIRKYIFPGADVPTLSELMPAIERSGLLVTDIEVLRLHYAETLKDWHKRFEANRDRVRELYDDRFCRMWELYLIGCEMGFRHQGLTVFQVQLAKRQDAVPLTRDYITEWERERGTKSVAAAE